MSALHPRLAQVLGAAFLRSARTGWFLVRIIVPLSAGVAILQWTGVLAWIGRLLAPAMGLFGLPGEAAVPLVSGYLAGVYGGVAAAAAIPMTRVQMTVLATMVLVAHNLVVESAVESRSGVSGLQISAVRLSTGLLLGALVWQTLRHGEQGAPIAAHAAATEAASGAAFFAAWAWGAAILVAKIFILVALLTIATELMRAYGLFDTLSRPVRPILRVLGLSDRVSFLWVTGIFLGIAYGAGLIIEEARTPGRFETGDLRDLHLSLGISHSLLEDTALFIAIGAMPLWILVPRLVAAPLVVRGVRRFLTERSPAALAVTEEGA